MVLASSNFSISPLAAFCLFVVLSFSVAAEEAPEVRLGLREILGEAQIHKARLGLIDDGESSLVATLNKIIRGDLTFIGLLDVLDVSPKERENYPDPCLELKATKGPQYYSVQARLLAQEEVLLSKNFKTTESDARKTGHLISREVLKNLTGEKGFFLSKIAFALRHKSHKEIWISDWDGKNAVPLTRWQSISLLPTWSNDGKTLVFTSFKEGNPDLYRHDFDKKSFKILSRYQGLNATPSWDPKGEGFLVTLSRGKDPNIYFVSEAGKILRRLTATRAIDTAPSFSPNGLEIAFTSDRSGNPQIFIMSRDGNNTRRLTYGFFWCDEAAWSPAGSLIAMACKKDAEEPFQIYVADPLGARFLQLTNVGSNEHPSFSPDGRLLAFSSERNGKGEIFLKGVTVETPEIRLISFEDSDAEEPSWSGQDLE